MTLTLDLARKLADLCLDRAREMNLKPLTVAVLDASGHLKVLLRQDGTSLLRSEIAQGKARGAIGMGLGSRALYLYQGSRDTLYRIHGTMDPSSIGKATSAGCIRLFNQDILDLYDETPLGTQVKVRSQAESARLEGPLLETPDGYLQPVSQVAQTAPAGQVVQ